MYYVKYNTYVSFIEWGIFIVTDIYIHLIFPIFRPKQLPAILFHNKTTG